MKAISIYRTHKEVVGNIKLSYLKIKEKYEHVINEMI